MGFLRRFLGGKPIEQEPAAPVGDAEADAAEQAYQRDLLRGEHERMTDLQRRQLRYSQYAWQPPDQGGERRSDDTDGERDASTEEG